MKSNIELRVNDVIRHFKVTRIVPLAELNATLVQMEHEGTGLRLVWLRRDEENMTFAITFETLPWDDSGVFHILEHSVLCGSDRYPVKEPFVELVKNSMNTFLNALTFSDKTMYPISSTNDKDFLNLMSVYLDAVFHPAIYHKEEIFAQEGWHFEREDKKNNNDDNQGDDGKCSYNDDGKCSYNDDAKYSYKGVVFNEMKGAFADSDELLMNALNRALFPDTPYAYCSGGDPKCIPTLTYEEFLDAHRKFYAPTNGIIYLDGDMDIDRVLGIIHEDFLKDFDRTSRVEQPQLQQAVDGGSQRIEYELPQEEDEESKYSIAWGKAFCSYEDREKQIAMGVLTDILAGNNEAYLTKLILEKGLAEDVSLIVLDGLMQPWIRLEVKNCKEENIPLIRDLIYGEIRRLCDEGISREKIEAALANNEFIANERDYGSYPQGLIFGFQVMEGMLYGGLPEQNLEVGHHFRKLKASVDDGYFEKLLREAVLDNKHTAEVILVPSKTLGEERRAEEEARVEAARLGWTAEEEHRINELQKSLEEWQTSEDSEEALATLPHLTLADLSDTPENLPIEVRDVSGIKVLRHNIDTADIRYVTLYFDIDDYSLESLPEITFATILLGNLGTEKMTAEEVMLKSDLLMGRFNTSISINSHRYSKTIGKVQLVARFSVLDDKLMDASGLVTEILTNTDFSDAQMIYDIVKQERSELMQQIVMGGHALGMLRTGAMYSEVAAAKEAIGGLSMYKWLKNLEENWNPELISELCRNTINKIIRSDRMTVSVTAGADFDESKLVEYLKSALAPRMSGDDDITACENSKTNKIKPTGVRREGIVIPADICFASRCGDIEQYNIKADNVALKLACRIISYAYLWNEVRVRGGAYGVGMKLDSTGLLSSYSYRDPGSSSTLDAYIKAADFIMQLAEDETNDLTSFIVGAVSDESPLMTPRVKGNVADNLYFAGITYEDRCRRRKKLLAVTHQELAELADCIRGCMSDGGVCIVGSEELIKKADVDDILTL